MRSTRTERASILFSLVDASVCTKQRLSLLTENIFLPTRYGLMKHLVHDHVTSSIFRKTIVLIVYPCVTYRDKNIQDGLAYQAMLLLLPRFFLTPTQA